jgi:hypothetical protein
LVAPGALIGWAIVATLIAFSTRTDPDLWGHVRFGLDAIRDHDLTYVDPYSFTQGVPWINHEWLSEAAMAVAYRTGGGTGLALLKAVLTTATLAIVWTALSGVSSGARLLSIILIGWSGLPMTGTLRPQLWSWLMCAATLALLSRRRALWVLPPLFACWANMHGGWIVGLGLVTVWACARRTRESWLLLAGCVVATLATPYGVRLWTFLATTVSLGRADIQEWQPAWTAPAITWVPTVAAWAILLHSAVQRRVPRSLWLGTVALGIAALRVMRLNPFFVMAVAIWMPQRRWPTSSPFARIDAFAAAVVFAAGLIFRAPSLACMPIAGDWVPDLTVVLHGTGTLLVPFNWGQYAIWRWGPSLKVSIDGRRETVYDNATNDSQWALERNEPTALGWLDAHPTDLVWYPRQATMVRNHLVSKGYEVLLDTPRSYILARPGTAATANTREVAPCFPAD